MMDPARIQFAASRRPASMLDEDEDPCEGCVFHKERSEVCQKAAAEAKLRKLPDCENGWVYVLVKVDTRQADLFT